ncbi:hypothetical protein [Streptomyces sp. PT12]|uniref:hypothetical protein n=1 Tax=Streptomyces sp. PT12 TaxID=1510197 RepID=UPI000DE4130D|nr:hypothetical protein [Streptomyces sp. PT12]RBM08086.1 hypothetical protein DEH69_24195 [Streptomyces sp. PT12]
MGDIDLSPLTEESDPLAALRAISELRQRLEREEAVLVRRARNDGATWTRIAAALGVSKQAVHKKYGGRTFLGLGKD